MKKLFYALIIALLAIIIFGIVVGAILLSKQDNFEKDITLSGDNIVSDSLNVSLDSFYPGKSMTYVVNFDGDIAGTYDVSLSFVQDGDCTFAKYLDLSVTLDGQELSAKKLSEYLDGEPFALTLDANGKDKCVLELTYTMSEEVGNEAQGAVADFRIEITAQRKGVV